VCKPYSQECNELHDEAANQQQQQQAQQQEKRKIKIKFAQLWKWKMHGQLCSKVIRNAAVHLKNTKASQQVVIYDSQSGAVENYFEEWELVPVLEK